MYLVDHLTDHCLFQSWNPISRPFLSKATYSNSYIHWWQWLPCKVLIRSSLGFSILPKDTWTCRPGEWTSDLPIRRRWLYPWATAILKVSEIYLHLFFCYLTEIQLPFLYIAYHVTCIPFTAQVSHSHNISLHAQIIQLQDKNKTWEGAKNGKRVYRTK